MQKMQKLSIKEIQGFSLARQDPFLIKLHNTPFSQCSNPFYRCKAWSATVFRNSSWRLARLRRMSRKSAKLWHRQCGHWKQGLRPLNLVPRCIASRAKWWARMKSSPMEYAYLDSPKWTPKEKKPSRGACQTPSRKRGDWRRNASRKEKVSSLLRLWIWIQLIAVPFYLALSRIGEADNPRPAHATTKLFGEQFEAIGQWATNLTSKSEMELTDKLSARVLRKSPTLTPQSVSQNIQGTHVSTEPGGDSAHTQQFSDYLSLFQVGNECDESRHVSGQMQFCDRSGKERDNPFCHHAKRGGRKHTGKKRELEVAEGVVNILQCNVTTWSEHAKHYILTSDFDAALISETHLEREKLVTAAKEARKFTWAGTGSEAISTASNGTSAGVLALVRTRWFSKPLSICADAAGVLCPTPRLAGRVIWVMGREILMTAYFEDSIGFRSDINANLMQDVCFLTRDGKLPFIFWERISISRQDCGKTVHARRQSLVTEVGSISQWSFQREPHTRAVQAKVKCPTSSIISWCLHSSDLSYRDAKL